MNKTINKSIVLGIMAILALGTMVMPLVASADRAGYVTPYDNTNFKDNVSRNNQYITYTEPSNPEPSTNPAPSIKSITPSSSNVGVGTKIINIVGTGFIPSSI